MEQDKALGAAVRLHDSMKAKDAEIAALKARLEEAEAEVEVQKTWVESVSLERDDYRRDLFGVAQEAEQARAELARLRGPLLPQPTGPGEWERVCRFEVFKRIGETLWARADYGWDIYPAGDIPGGWRRVNEGETAQKAVESVDN